MQLRTGRPLVSVWCPCCAAFALMVNRGALFLGPGFRVTRNKLTFRDNLSMLLESGSPVDRQLEKRFKEWLVKCHKELDRTIKFEALCSQAVQVCIAGVIQPGSMQGHKLQRCHVSVGTQVAAMPCFSSVQAVPYLSWPIPKVLEYVQIKCHSAVLLPS